ncbi:MAG: hypothetical protein IPK79_10430 [Vampirovibrionales bacterium]|nr:hypothetical protein [Vampirovibrionales bacterium]
MSINVGNNPFQLALTQKASPPPAARQTTGDASLIFQKKDALAKPGGFGALYDTPTVKNPFDLLG